MSMKNSSDTIGNRTRTKIQYLQQNFSRNIIAGFINYSSQILVTECNAPHQLHISILGSCQVCVLEKRDCKIFCLFVEGGSSHIKTVSILGTSVQYSVN